MKQVLENMKVSFAVMIDRAVEEFIKKISSDTESESRQKKIVANAETCKKCIEIILNTAEEKIETLQNKHIENFKSAMDEYSKESMEIQSKRIALIGTESSNLSVVDVPEKPSVHARRKIKDSAKKMEEYLLMIQMQAITDCENAYILFETEAGVTRTPQAA